MPRHRRSRPDLGALCQSLTMLLGSIVARAFSGTPVSVTPQSARAPAGNANAAPASTTKKVPIGGPPAIRSRLTPQSPLSRRTARVGGGRDAITSIPKKGGALLRAATSFRWTTQGRSDVSVITFNFARESSHSLGRLLTFSHACRRRAERRRAAEVTHSHRSP